MLGRVVQTGDARPKGRLRPKRRRRSHDEQGPLGRGRAGARRAGAGGSGAPSRGARSSSTTRAPHHPPFVPRLASGAYFQGMNVKPYFSRSSANGYAFRFVWLALPRGRGVRIVADRPLSAAEAKAGAFAGARARVDGSVRSRVWVGLGPGAGGGPPNTAPYAGPHFAAALGAAIEIEVVVALPVNEPAGRCALSRSGRTCGECPGWGVL